MKLLLSLILSFPALGQNVVFIKGDAADLPPQSTEVTTTAPSLADRVQSNRLALISRLQNEFTQFEGYTLERQNELQEKYGLHPAEATIEEVDQTLQSWSKNQFIKYQAHRDLEDLGLSRQELSLVAIEKLEYYLDYFDFQMMAYFNEFYQHYTSDDSPTQNRQSQNQNGNTSSSSQVRVQTNHQVRSGEDFNGRLIQFIEQSIPMLHHDSFTKERNKMVKMVELMPVVTRTQYQFFKAQMAIRKSPPNLGTPGEFIRPLDYALSIKDPAAVTEAFNYLQKVLVLSNRYTLLKNLDKFVGNPYFAMGVESVSIPGINFSDSSDVFLTLGVWTKFSQLPMYGEFIETLKSYIDSLAETLDNKPNYSEATLLDSLQEIERSGFVDLAKDMNKASLKTEPAFDIRFLLNSAERTVTFGRTVEFKLAQALLLDEEFRSRMGTTFLKNALRGSGSQPDSVMPMFSQYADPQKILKAIKTEIQKTASWDDPAGGPWSYTQTKKALKRFFVPEAKQVGLALTHKASNLWNRLSGKTDGGANSQNQLGNSCAKALDKK